MVEMDDYRFKYDVHTHTHTSQIQLNERTGSDDIITFKVKNKTQVPTVSQLLKLFFNL